MYNPAFSVTIKDYQEDSRPKKELWKTCDEGFAIDNEELHELAENLQL